MPVIRIEDGQPYITATVRANGKEITLSRVLLDTGSKGTFFQTDLMHQLDVVQELGDRVESIAGVGGSTSVLMKTVESISVDDLTVSPFIIEMGWLDAHFGIDGILGMDFLLQVRAQIDFAALELRQG